MRLRVQGVVSARYWERIYYRCCSSSQPGLKNSEAEILEIRKDVAFIYYIYSFSSYIFMFSPIWVIFLLQHDYTMVQVGVIDAIYWLSLFVFQIPAGLLSDRYPRTYIMALSSMFVGMAIIVFAFPVHFWVVVFSYVLWAVGVAMKNVGDSAWLFDYVHTAGVQHRFSKMYGYGMAISQISIGIAALIGGYLGSMYSLQFPILLSGVLILFSGLLPFLLPCPPRAIRRENVIVNLKESVKIVRANRNLYFLLFLGGIYAALDGVFIILKQPFMYYIGLSVSHIGLIYLVFTFVGASASFSMHKIEKAMGRRVLFLTGFLPLASIFVLLVTPGFLAVTGVIMFSFTTGLTLPLLVYYVNLEVPSDKRGVMLSYMSVIYTAILIPLSPVCGFLADVSINLAIISLFGLCVPLLALVVLAYRTRK
ncbi:MAG: MFS transporter [Thermoplasmata archaeon]|nr:MFS transporter [Thermoplasmata archaeon]